MNVLNNDNYLNILETFGIRKCRNKFKKLCLKHLRKKIEIQHKLKNHNLNMHL